MTFATTIARLPSRHLRNGQRALRLAKNTKVGQKRYLSSLDYDYGCDALSATADEDERLLNDLAYSLSMASANDAKVFPLGHEPNRQQQRQLWLSKTQPLLGQVWIEKGGFRPTRPSNEEEESS